MTSDRHTTVRMANEAEHTVTSAGAGARNHWATFREHWAVSREYWPASRFHWSGKKRGEWDATITGLISA